MCEQPLSGILSAGRYTGSSTRLCNYLLEICLKFGPPGRLEAERNLGIKTTTPSGSSLWLTWPQKPIHISALPCHIPAPATRTAFSRTPQPYLGPPTDCSRLLAAQSHLLNRRDLHSRATLDWPPHTSIPIQALQPYPSSSPSERVCLALD